MRSKRYLLKRVALAAPEAAADAARAIIYSTGMYGAGIWAQGISERAAKRCQKELDDVAREVLGLKGAPIRLEFLRKAASFPNGFLNEANKSTNRILDNMLRNTELRASGKLLDAALAAGWDLAVRSHASPTAGGSDFDVFEWDHEVEDVDTVEARFTTWQHEGKGIEVPEVAKSAFGDFNTNATECVGRRRWTKPILRSRPWFEQGLCRMAKTGVVTPLEPFQLSMVLPDLDRALWDSSWATVGGKVKARRALHLLQELRRETQKIPEGNLRKVLLAASDGGIKRKMASSAILWAGANRTPKAEVDIRCGTDSFIAEQWGLLKAIRMVLKEIRSQQHPQGYDIFLATDCQSFLQLFESLVERNGMRKVSVLERDILDALGLVLKANPRNRFRFLFTPSHCGVQVNELADELATMGLLKNKMGKKKPEKLQPVARRQNQTLRERFGSENHYVVLGVPLTASNKDIRRAWRKLMLEHHPDKGGDHATFIKCKNAYDVLICSETRRRFDRNLQDQRSVAESQPMEKESGDHSHRHEKSKSLAKKWMKNEEAHFTEHLRNTRVWKGHLGAMGSVSAKINITDKLTVKKCRRINRVLRTTALKPRAALFRQAGRMTDAEHRAFGKKGLHHTWCPKCYYNEGMNRIDSTEHRDACMQCQGLDQVRVLFKGRVEDEAMKIDKQSAMIDEIQFAAKIRRRHEE